MKMRTQLLLGYAVVFALMIVIAGITYHSINALIENQTRVHSAQEVKTSVRLLMRVLVDMETGVRGYALTGRETFLEPYWAGEIGYESTIAELRGMVSDPAQSARLRKIESITARWQHEAAQPVIQARRDLAEGAAGSGMGQVIAFIEKETGKILMDSIRDSVTEFVDVENGLLAQQELSAGNTATRSIWAVILSTSLALALGFAAVSVTARAVLRQVGGEPAAIMSVTREIAQGNLEVECDEIKKANTGIAASVAEIVASFQDAIRQANAVASGDYGIEIAPRSVKDELRIALQGMTAALRENRDRIQRQDWLKTGIARLKAVMVGDTGIETLASKVISEIATWLDAQVGAFYLAHEGGEPALSLVGSYAYKKHKNLSNEFRPGEGLVGQAAHEKQQILVRNVPDDYIKVTSGLGEHIPRFICVTPFLYEGRLKGVIEIATLNEMTDHELEYLEQAMPALAVAVESAQGRTNQARLLEESQALSEELQVQQKELKNANEELEEQTQRLEESSEEKLRAQQEELEVSNEELEEKNDLLERQKKEVERARKELEEKAQELAVASKYKSEFLANMSHELRTPLNSLLLLAQSLAENREGNLTEEEVESARIIHGGGSDLLNLINEILDLSKIEAGRVELQPGSVQVSDLAEGVRVSFMNVAAEKGLELEVVVSKDAPAELTSDQKRVEQVIRNLVSNAVKFTESGGVTVTFDRPDPGTDLSRSGLSAGECLVVAVRDTGIGIDPDQQKIIFEAFQQADGGTARNYGGTGLGLSISRELVRLLGGEMQLESESEKGSTFTLYLPIVLPEGRGAASGRTTASTAPQIDTGAVRNTAHHRVVAVQIEDDREKLEEGDRIILVVEDDPNFARLLYRKCHEKGFKCLAALTGEEGLELAGRYVPSAVILDIRLPGMNGWTVLSALKEDTRTRHIPVHIVSVEEASTEALRRGAVGHATKPLDQKDLEETFRRLEQVSTEKPRRVLIVEDDAEIRRKTAKLIGNGDVKVDEVETGEQALEALRSGCYDCVVLDLGLPDMGGLELIEKLEREGVELPPVIVNTARDLTREEEAELREHADSIVIKDVRSQERLLDEVSLFLHRVVSQMPRKKQQMIRDLHNTDTFLRDKKVLIVDDDMRTTFAVSRLLSEWGMKPLKAENGARALKLLDEEPDVALVLMDIMMPVMDGYEAMKRIRVQDRFRTLPIIALTAKAMPEDREKCLAAGANDYLPKPVDQGRLISMMRVWLYR